MRVQRCSQWGGQLHLGISHSGAALAAAALGSPKEKIPIVKPSLGDVHIHAVYQKYVLIRVTMSFCFVLKNPAFGIETCQEPNDLAEQIEKSRAINCKGIHFMVNTRACCEKQDYTHCPSMQIPINVLTKFPAKPWCLTQYFLKQS